MNLLAELFILGQEFFKKRDVVELDHLGFVLCIIAI